MRCPHLEGCSKQKWTANGKSFKNPTRHTVRCRACGFSRGSLKWVDFAYNGPFPRKRRAVKARSHSVHM